MDFLTQFPEHFSGNSSGTSFQKTFPEDVSGYVSIKLLRGTSAETFPGKLSGKRFWKFFCGQLFRKTFTGQFPRTLFWTCIPFCFPRSSVTLGPDGAERNRTGNGNRMERSGNGNGNGTERAKAKVTAKSTFQNNSKGQ